MHVRQPQEEIPARAQPARGTGGARRGVSLTPMAAVAAWAGTRSVSLEMDQHGVQAHPTKGPTMRAMFCEMRYRPSTICGHGGTTRLTGSLRHSQPGRPQQVSHCHSH